MAASEKPLLRDNGRCSGSARSWPKSAIDEDLPVPKCQCALLRALPTSGGGTILAIALTFCLLAFSGVGALLLLCQWWVHAAGDNRIFNSADDLPENEVGLVLGT